MSVQRPADSEKHFSSLFTLLPSVSAVLAVVPLEYRAALFRKLKDFISEVLQNLPGWYALGPSLCPSILQFSNLNAGPEVELVHEHN